jgi:hypothetical protein
MAVTNPLASADPSAAQAPGQIAADQAAAPVRAVPTRRVSFEDLLDSLPRHFAGPDHDDLLHSHLAAAMSSVFGAALP